MYSNPPKHGAAIASAVLNDPELLQEWKVRLSCCSSSLQRVPPACLEPQPRCCRARALELARCATHCERDDCLVVETAASGSRLFHGRRGARAGRPRLDAPHPCAALDSP
jgi:hypothetical protein